MIRIRNRGLRIICLLSLAFSLSAPCGGPESESETRETPTVEERIVVSAQFVPESQAESIYRVKVLDRERIRAQAAGDLRELLSHELGMDLTQHTVFGSSLAIGGLSHENVKVLVDGVPVVGRLDGVIDLQQLNLADVRQVEVIEGPVSVYYGTDALAGMVHLVTREAGTEKLAGSLVGTYLSEGERRGSADLSLRKGDHAVWAGISAKGFDGLDSDGLGRRLEWARRDQEWGDFGYGFLWKDLKWRYSARGFEERLEDLGEPVNGVAKDLTYNTRRISHSLSVKGLRDGGLYWDLTLARSDYRRFRETRLYHLATGVTGEPDPLADNDLNRFGQWMLRGFWTKDRILPELDLQWGFDWVGDEGEGPRILDGGKTMEDTAAFAGFRWRPAPGWTLQPALRIARNSDYSPPPTPAFHAKYDGVDRLTLRGSYAKGFRGPSIKELYLDFTMAAGPFVYEILGSPELKPERGDHSRISAEYNLPETTVGSLAFDGGLFHNRVENLIELSPLLPDPTRPNTFHRHYVNVTDHKSYGADLGFGISHARWAFSTKLYRLYTLNEFSRQADLPDYNAATDAALQLSFGTRQGMARFSAFYKRVGARSAYYEVGSPTSEPNPIRGTTLPSYQRLDCGAVLRLGAGFEMDFGVKNLFDATQLENLDELTGAAHAVTDLDWGRTFYLTLRYGI